jgi:hypothetical protein
VDFAWHALAAGNQTGGMPVDLSGVTISDKTISDLPVDAMLNPLRSPLRILERLLGTPLA